jgi:hypothetical protein
MIDLTPKLAVTIGTGQDCAAAGYWAVTYLHRAGSSAVVGRIGRTSDRRWHVVLDGQETHTATMAQAKTWVNRRA